MAAGQYSFAGKKPQAPVKFELVPNGIYNSVLKTGGAEIKPPSEPGKAPRVGGIRFELPELLTPSGKPRMVFHDIYVSLKPGKDGVIMPQRPAGLLALAQSINVELSDFDTVEVAGPDGEDSFQVLNPQQVMEWLKENDGAECRIDVRKKKGGGGYDDRNEVTAILPADGDLEYESGEEAEEEEVKPAKKASPATKTNGKKK